MVSRVRGERDSGKRGAVVSSPRNGHRLHSGDTRIIFKSEVLYRVRAARRRNPQPSRAASPAQ